MITFDITLPGGEKVPLTLHNKEILKMFMEHKGKLIEFIDMAIKELKDDESDIVRIKLKELPINLNSCSHLPLDVYKKAKELTAGEFINWWFNKR